MSDASPSPAEHPLRAYRRQHDLSQESIARLADCTKATISRIESGGRGPTFSLTRRLIAATNGAVTADMLISWSAGTRANP